MVRAALYLSSESPRRQALLGQLGVAFVTISAAIDETWNGVETPACYVERLALEKAQFGWRSIAQRDPLPVLGADTALVLEDAILGKPGDPSDAVNMLAALSGRRYHLPIQVRSTRHLYFRNGVLGGLCALQINRFPPLFDACSYSS